MVPVLSAISEKEIASIARADSVRIKSIDGGSYSLNFIREKPVRVGYNIYVDSFEIHSSSALEGDLLKCRMENGRRAAQNS